MANMLASLNDHIRRLARREARGQTRITRKASANFRRDIAALKRLLRGIQSRIATVEKQARASARSAAASAPEALSENIRFRADGLRTHRAKLGISAKDYGKLVGVSALTIYNWEAGKSRPRRKQLAGLVSVRGLGKREALKRLGD